MSNLTSTHTIRQSADVINATRKHGEQVLNELLVAIERQNGTDHLVAAHALAIELYNQEHTFPRYVKCGNVISEQRDAEAGWRFYTYEAAWQISPASANGYTYQEV